MRVAKRWRKQFIPIVMLLAPPEDTRQYSIMYSIASLLHTRDKLNICGDGQIARSLPSPATPSKDLIEDENGRTIKVAGLRERWK